MITFFNKGFTARFPATLAIATASLLGSVSLANAQILSTTSTAAPSLTTTTPVVKPLSLQDYAGLGSNQAQDVAPSRNGSMKLPPRLPPIVYPSWKPKGVRHIGNSAPAPLQPPKIWPFPGAQLQSITPPGNVMPIVIPDAE